LVGEGKIREGANTPSPPGYSPCLNFKKFTILPTPFSPVLLSVYRKEAIHYSSPHSIDMTVKK
jgi:hypothetical protein